jgi:hypothetical protein
MFRRSAGPVQGGMTWTGPSTRACWAAEKRGHLRPPLRPAMRAHSRWGHHAQRGVPPVPVVVLDPGADPGPGLCPGREVLRRAQLEFQGGCQDSMTALSSADPGRPIDWRMPSRSQAWRTRPAVYCLGSRDRRNTFDGGVARDDAGAAAAGSAVPGADAFSGPADGGLARGPGAVLGGYQTGRQFRGRGLRGRRVARGRDPLVSPGWRGGCEPSAGGVRPFPVLH